MKSVLVSVMWPAWVWTWNPEHQWLCGSYASKLASRDNRYMRRLVDSKWYRDRWGAQFTLTKDQNEKIRFENDRGGYRIAFGMAGGVMGDGGDTVLIDDPHDRQSAHSDTEREREITTFDEGVSTRLNDPDTSAIVVIMQRLHALDLSGHLLKQGGWDLLCIPMRHEPAHPTPSKTALGWKDPRKFAGELMWPARFPESALAKAENTLGPYGVAGQLQQRPSQQGGAILVRDWWKVWDKWELDDAGKPQRKLPRFHKLILSFDTAFKEGRENDYTAMTAWGMFALSPKKRSQSDSRDDYDIEVDEEYGLLLLHAWRDRIKFPELRKTALDWYRNPKWKRLPDYVIIEDKGSGQSLIQELHVAGVPVRPFNPGRESKVMRAHTASTVLKAGVVYALGAKETDPELRAQGVRYSNKNVLAWAEEVLSECEKFPNGEHDDYVDTCVQAWSMFRAMGDVKTEHDDDGSFDEEREPEREVRRGPMYA